ncbi:BglII/BstYI family type II restriction endonuclease [Pseudoxanthobacter sp.]|uniref:BglII/BstYI family type II restriction endonuclease n=1 Tax=Pseudoxanthobacter sp. TaxID=1925742 RepID=UPI002FE0BDDB
MFESLLARGFQIEYHSHARAILGVDFPDALAELETVLGDVSIPIDEIVGSGGGEAKGTRRLRKAFDAHGWVKTKFTIEKRINGVPRESISHEVDHVRTFPDSRVVALEIEWNNKDPFFDRDLENFKRLHAEGAISVGVIVTRGITLQDDMPALVRRFARERRLSSMRDVQALGLNPTPRQTADVNRRIGASGASFSDAWALTFCADKYGASTTHWRKLEDRIHRGVGNPCPLLLVGLPSSVVTFEPVSPGDPDQLSLTDLLPEPDWAMDERS